MHFSKIDFEITINNRKTFVDTLEYELRYKTDDFSIDIEYSKKINVTKFFERQFTAFFMQADKGNFTVCIERDKYLTKMQNLSNNQKEYRLIPRENNLLIFT